MDDCQCYSWKSIGLCLEAVYEKLFVGGEGLQATYGADEVPHLGKGSAPYFSLPKKNRHQFCRVLGAGSFCGGLVGVDDTVGATVDVALSRAGGVTAGAADVPLDEPGRDITGAGTDPGPLTLNKMTASAFRSCTDVRVADRVPSDWSICIGSARVTLTAVASP